MATTMEYCSTPERENALGIKRVIGVHHCTLYVQVKRPIYGIVQAKTRIYTTDLILWSFSTYADQILKNKLQETFLIQLLSA